jgi:hypothetical protein
VFTTAHLTSGLVVALALGLHGQPFALLVAASVLVDWDFSIQILTGRNHRTLLSHSPPVVAAALALLALRWPLAWWLLAGAMLHFALDVWEYGLRLNPFSRRIYGLRLLPGVENETFPRYLRRYFGDWRFLAAEVALAGAAGALALLRVRG